MILNGSGSANTLTGGAGDDTFYVQNGPSTMTGGGGHDTYLTSPVVEVLANYRFDNNWFVAGGIVSRLNPRLRTDDPDYQDIDFRTATGVTVEAGWSFIGVYCTYMRYESSRVNLDASSVGLRFTMRFRKWRPVR